MTSVKPLLRTVPSDDGVRSSKPVSAATWQSVGAGLNWVNASGRQLIPMTHVGVSWSTGTKDLLFQTQASPRHHDRAWVIIAQGSGVAESMSSGATPTLTVRSPASNGTTSSYFLAPDRESVRPIVKRQSLTALPSGAEELTLRLGVLNGSATVLSVGLFEIDRPVLAVASPDYGIQTPSIQARQPIRDVPGESLAGLVDAYVHADGRRVGHFSWSVPSGDAVAVSSTTATSLFEEPIPVVPRKIYHTDTAGQLKWAARVKVSSGTGEVTVGGVTKQVTATSWAWVTGTAAITAEDLSHTVAALPGGDFPSITPTLKKYTSGTISIMSLSVYEED